MSGDGVKTDRRRPKRARESKTMWFAAVVAAASAALTAAPEAIPAAAVGPAGIAIAAAIAALRVVTANRVR